MTVFFIVLALVFLAFLIIFFVNINLVVSINEEKSAVLKVLWLKWDVFELFDRFSKDGEKEKEEKPKKKKRKRTPEEMIDVLV